MRDCDASCNTYTVCVATGSRAEYHLLQPLIRALKDDGLFTVNLAVTGSHLSVEYGATYTFIEEDGYAIDVKIPILDGDDSHFGIDRAFGAAAVGFGSYFEASKPDLVCILGDRYEMLAVAFAALNHGVPLAHIHGGELTLGAIDDAIRHAITKMSALHFTSCEAYRKRVIQLGENPSRVFNVGALGVENIRCQEYLSVSELSDEIGFSFTSPTALITYHATTLAGVAPEQEIAIVLEALDEFPDMAVLFTKANADFGGIVISEAIEEYVKTRNNGILVSSLGAKRYLSALSAVDVVIGNSSSALLETVPFGVPVVNIGERQRGRIAPDNVISCALDKTKITEAITLALSPLFRKKAEQTNNPYGEGFVSEAIVRKIKKALKGGISQTKEFYDL